MSKPWQQCPRASAGQIPAEGDVCFGDLFESMTLGVVYQAGDGRIIDANPAACSILGLTRDEILGRTSVDPRWKTVREDGSPFPGEEHPAMIALRTGKPVRGVTMGVFDPRREGTRWILADSVPGFRDGEAEPFQVYTTFNDITDLRTTIRALRDSEERARSFVAESPMGVFLYRLEPDGRLVFSGSNPAADQILRLNSDQFLGMTIEEAFPPLADTEVPEAYRRVARTGEPWESEQVDYEDERIRGAYQVHAFRTAPDTVAVLFLEITERKRVEDALRRSEESYRTLFESAGDCLFLMRGMEFIDCNSKAVELFGATREEIIGQPPGAFSPPLQPDGQESFVKARDHLNRADAGEVVSFEWAHVRPDGTPFDVKVTLNRLPVAGESLLLASVRDITSQKQMEEQLALAQKMETVGQLAGGVAHDFNNLLAPILGYSELLLSEIDPRNAHWAEVDEIRKAAERARTLTRQLLAFSRKQVLEVRYLNLNEVITGFHRILRRTIREDIEIRIEPGQDLGTIHADPHQVEQVLLNLAINASDAMTGSGALTVETSNVTLNPSFIASHPDLAPGRYVMLAVSDTGEGMDPETLRRIFEPFFTTKEKGKGTGLGLATVYGIVRQHRGTILATSRPGEGSRFEIFLPRVENPVAAGDPARTETGSKTGSETIVVVEDNQMVRDLACRVLRSHGYDVIEADQAETCLELLASETRTVDLLLTDVIMPGLNGKQLYEKLASMRPGLRVLYMSGYTDDVIARHGILEKGVELIQKPFSVGELTNRIRQVLGSR